MTPSPAEPPTEDAAPLPDVLRGFWLADEHEITAQRSTQLVTQLRHVAVPPRGLQHFMSADIMAADAAQRAGRTGDERAATGGEGARAGELAFLWPAVADRECSPRDHLPRHEHGAQHRAQLPAAGILRARGTPRWNVTATASGKPEGSPRNSASCSPPGSDSPTRARWARRRYSASSAISRCRRCSAATPTQSTSSTWSNGFASSRSSSAPARCCSAPS